MNSTAINNRFISQMPALTEAARKDLDAALESFVAGKGDLLLDSGRVCRHLYFINTGLCKTSFYKDDKEFIMRFFAEGSIFTVLDSFVSQVPSAYSITVLEPGSYLRLSFDALQQLAEKHHCIETFFRRLVSNAAVNMMNRINELLEDNASERYAAFLRDQAHLVQRISLGDLAGYLGITQVSLSRIRSAR